MTITCALYRRRGPWRNASLLALSLALIGLNSCSKSNNGSPTAPSPVASVTVNLPAATIGVGNTGTLTATPEDANNHPLGGVAVTWSSDHPEFATVNSSGVVTAVSAGTADITATCQGKSASTTITVSTVQVATVTVGPAPAGVAAGTTVLLTATPKDGSNQPLDGRIVTWSSANPAIATVDGNGLVSGVLAGGPVNITATCETRTGTSAVTVTPRLSGGQFSHVFIVAEENRNYASVIGDAAMPYLNGLAQTYGLATQYYANTNPSIGNYLMMTCGQIITNDDTWSTTINVDNVVRELNAAGKTWKAYAEDLPSVGFVTLNYENSYASRHNPVVYYTDVHDHPDQAAHVVPFTQFATDLATYNFPNYSFIVPNVCNDGHDCGNDVVDAWLKNNIDPLVKNAHFQQDGLLIVVYDESEGDGTNGGGRIVWVAVSGKSKHAYQSTTLYQHESTLRLSLKALGVNVFPGAAATAPDMSEFFNP